MTSLKTTLYSSLGVSLFKSFGEGTVERTGNTTMILLLGDSNNATGKITAPDTDDTVKACLLYTSDAADE